MTNYVIINGVNSNTINGLGINELPPITKPLQRSLIEEIDGRDGDIITKLGYGAYDKTMTIGLFHTYDIDEVIAFFNGEGTITFSNEPDKVYYFTILDQIDYEKLINFKTATITLHCQPFKYPIEETPIEVAYQYVEGEGESITLENTAEAQMQLDLLGNTQQDSTTGKNLLNLSGLFQTKFSGNTTNDKGITFTNNNGTINLKGTATGTAECIIGSWNGPAALLELDSSKTYTLKIFGKDKNGSTIYAGADIRGIKNGSGAKIIYGNDTADYITITGWSSVVYFDIYTNYTGGATNKDISIQIEESSSPTSYEPYTNGASPNPDYPQPIHTCSGDNTINICGKNLFDKTQTLYQGYYGSNGSWSTSTNQNWTFTQKVEPNTTYTISKLSTLRLRVFKISSLTPTSSLRSGKLLEYQSSNTGGTFTTPSDCEYIGVFFYDSGGEQYTLQQVLDSMQLELGSSATTYEPYTGQSHLISLGDIELNKIGTYQDYIYKEDGKWYLHKEIGKVVLDGSEVGWTYQSSLTRFLLPKNSYNFLKNALTQNQRTEIYMDYFHYLSSGLEDGLCFIYDGGLYLYYYDLTTESALISWLSANTPTIYYILATPTNTEITDSTLLEALENIYSMTGITNITQENNDLPFTINAKTLMQGSGTATINNIGNVYSKPTLDIVGNGVVNVSLNGNQIFSVNVSDEIVIDSTNLEAYNPTTHELMNRQVTGNIANLKLDPEENTLTISGDLDTATITNYVRWL